MMNERHVVFHSSFIIPHSSLSLLFARALLALLLRRLDLARARDGRGRRRRFVVRRDARGRRRLRLLRAGLGGRRGGPSLPRGGGPRAPFWVWAGGPFGAGSVCGPLSPAG